MKTLLLLFVFITACSPLDDVRDDCKEEADKAVEQCVAFYEDVAIPAIEEQINTTVDDLQTWFEEQVALLKADFEQALKDKEIEVMTNAGCVVVGGNWDCSNATFCR